MPMAMFRDKVARKDRDIIENPSMMKWRTSHKSSCSFFFASSLIAPLQWREVSATM